MKTHICQFLIASAAWLCCIAFAQEPPPPEPCGAVPSDKQLQWLNMEWYAFVHFGINTFTDKEWGYGNESPGLFCPTSFDANDIVRVFKAAGMRGMVYTAKHHDGFCLWPTHSTARHLGQSPWKDGQGDIVREFADACAEQHFAFGVYVSPWDRHHAEYARPAYLECFYTQIRELLTQYGPLFEIWLDGANGGDGYYGGACEQRSIGREEDYYQFPALARLIRSLQPGCIIWGAGDDGDVRWAGSESGVVPYPCWNLLYRDTPLERWISWEADTPINRSGWFWHPHSETQVKSPAALMRIYFASVGHGSNLILNIAPNRDGQLDPADVASLLRFGELRRQLLVHDAALHADARASEVRGHSPRYAAACVTDGNPETYWAPEDGTCTGELELQLPEKASFDVVRLREYIRLGQRVSSFQIDVWVDHEWKTVDAAGETIGFQTFRKLPDTVTTDRVRIRITGARACPCISEISLLKMPDMAPSDFLPRADKES